MSELFEYCENCEYYEECDLEHVDLDENGECEYYQPLQILKDAI